MSPLLLRPCTRTRQTPRTHLHVNFMAFIHKNQNNQCVIYSSCNRTHPSSRLDPARVTGSANLSSISVKSHNFDRSVALPARKTKQRTKALRRSRTFKFSNDSRNIAVMLIKENPQK